MSVRLKKALFSLVLCLNLCACDNVYRFLHKEGAQEKKLIGESVPFEKNPTVQEIQLLLQIYGYSSGKIDGVIGARTRVAIERFQKDNGLEVTRFVDDATWIKLKVFKDTPFIKNNQLNVQIVQQALQHAGYNPGSQDGRFGQKTKLAISAFQKANGLKADGRVGYQTLTKLLKFVSKE